MGLTTFNPNSLALLNIINQTSMLQSQSMMRLSTGSRINRASDDPAGLIALQSMNAELTALSAGIDSANRANSMLDVVDSGMSEIGDLLGEIESLAAASTSSGGLSSAEIAANQAQIDQALTAIDRIVKTTTFNGKRLLDGSQAINASASSGSANVSDLTIYSRSAGSSSTSLSVAVTTSATQATKASYATTSAASNSTIQVTGSQGTATIDIAAGTNLSAVAAAINTYTSDTGVVASASSGNTALHLHSQGYGTDEFVKVNTISGDTTNYGNYNVTGVDAVVTVNGAATTADGKDVYISNSGVSGVFTLTSAGNAAGQTATISVSGGGMTFQLGTESSTRSTIGVQAPLTDLLGNSTDGYLASLAGGQTNSLASDANQAVTIVRSAISQLAQQRGRIGAFQSFQVETSVNSMSAAKEALSSARSMLNDVDYATETAELNRQQVLMQAATSLLGLANQQGAQILSLL